MRKNVNSKQNEVEFTNFYFYFIFILFLYYPYLIPLQFYVKVNFIFYFSSDLSYATYYSMI